MTGRNNKFQTLLRDLKCDDKVKRRSAAWDLGAFGKKSWGKLAVNPLIEALQDEDNEVREYAAESLGKFGDMKAIEPLINLLKDQDYEILCSIGVSLNLLCQLELTPLITALRTGDRDTREGAATALSQIRSKETVPPLILALKDADKMVRVAVIDALARIKDTRAVLPLKEMLSDTYYLVRVSATHALGVIGDPRTIEWLLPLLSDEDASVRQSIIGVLGKLGGVGVITPLLEALRDEDNDVRLLACSTLGQVGNADAIPVLEQIRARDFAKARFGKVVSEEAGRAIEKINQRLHNPQSPS